MKLSAYVLIFVLFLSFALLSFAKKMDVNQVRESIKETNAKFTQAFNQCDAAGVAELYTDGAILLPLNSKMIQGEQSIQKFWDGGIIMELKDLNLTTVDVGGSGDVAYEIGKYTFKIQSEG